MPKTRFPRIPRMRQERGGYVFLPQAREFYTERKASLSSISGWASIIVAKPRIAANMLMKSLVRVQVFYD